MFSIYQLKPAFQNSLQPILILLRKKGITANQLTLLALLYSICLGASFFFYLQIPFILLLIPIGLLIRMGLNALDGMMARQFHMQSKLGEILNEMGDIISDLAIILPLVILPNLNPWIIVTFGFLTMLNEFAGVLGKAITGERRYEGPMGKSDRALLIALFCLFMYIWPTVSVYGNWVFSGGIALLMVSTYARMKKIIA